MRKANANTLAHLLNAMTSGRAVKIRYIKENGEVSRRRIEIHSSHATSKGNITLLAWDERDQEMTTFRVDRITHYTLHRVAKLAAYQHPVYATEAVDLLDEDGEVTGFSAWGTFELAA